MKVNRFSYLLYVIVDLMLIPIFLPSAVSCKSFGDTKTANPGIKQVADVTCESGAITRGDSTQNAISLVFTGDMYAEGGSHIMRVLDSHNIKGSFFFTGNFYRNPLFNDLIVSLLKGGHYLGPHSDKHLLYCDWENRDSLLVTEEEFKKDIMDNFMEMKRFGIEKEDAPFFLPPYEWYNSRIADWSSANGLILINYTPGTKSHADYTTPGMSSYADSGTILKSIFYFNETSASGLNGFILLSHVGAGPEREDKFYLQLDELISELESEGYTFCRIDSLPGLSSL